MILLYNYHSKERGIMKENKKISLMEDKNDLYQKQAQKYLKKRVIKSALDTYTGAKVDDKEVRKFVAYLDRFVRQT